MPRFAPQMKQEELCQMIFDLAKKNDYEEDYGPIDPLNPDLSGMMYMLLGEEFLPTVSKDWEKVDFSWENLDVVGIKYTQDGIPYLELSVGGDWENPIVAIVYFDGKKFRGFVPKSGNPYNHKTKSAFGNDEGDLEQAKKQFGTGVSDDDGHLDIEPDMVKVTAEINARLEAKGTFVPGAKAVVSNAALKKKKQAEIEKGLDLSGDITADMVYAVIHLAAGAAYVKFELRASRRELTVDEGKRLVGVPKILEMSLHSREDKSAIWYSPMGYYPVQTHKVLEAAGFEKAPDNDLSPYANARTVYITL